MSYELVFDQRALKEWKKLDYTIQKQLKQKLQQVLVEPHIPGSRLRELPHCYKIKLRKSGYRLIYQVQQKRLIVLVLAVGKRVERAGLRGRGKTYNQLG